MNQRIAHQILHRLLQRPIKTASDQLAIRWLFANLLSSAAEYDLYFRLQLLEGALGVPEGTWWTKGRRGLSEAVSASKGLAVSPEWLDPGNTGMFSILYRTTSKYITKNKGVAIEPDDIIQSTLMGLGKDMAEVGTKPVYSTGKTFSNQIKSGKETPKTIAAGPMGRMLETKVTTEAIHLHQLRYKNKEEKDESFKQMTHVRQDAEGNPYVNTLETKAPDDDTQDRILIHLFFWDQGTLGKKIREFMRKSWEGTGQQVAMDTWLNQVEAHQVPSKTEIAKELGMNLSSFTQRHWNVAWKRFYKKLQTSPLVRAIEAYFDARGVPFEIPDTEMAFPTRKIASALMFWFSRI